MKTLLYPKHQIQGAHFVNFGEWEMPLHYRGIKEEHLAVRSNVGLFDVSHMGKIAIEGKDAEIFLDYVAANKIAGKKEKSATYTVLCSSTGGSIDDTIIYCIDREHYFMVANAANRQKDLAHLQEHSANYKVKITPYYHEEGILALQGPKSKFITSALFPESTQLNHPMQLIQVEYLGCPIYISSTGYTGAGGFEFYVPNQVLELLWDQLLQLGASHGIMPIGLGARNTLRLEMGYALYGHEIDDTIAPIESVAAWSVKLAKSDFLGKSALQNLDKSPNKRSMCGLLLKDPGVIRDQYLVFKEGAEIGIITSGGYSPTLNQSIALGLLHENIPVGTSVEVQIRKQMCTAKIVSIPFIQIQKDKESK